MKIVFLGCGYLGYNLSKLCSKYADVKCLGIPSEYSGLLEDEFIEVDVFNNELLSKIDLEDAIVIDTVTLIGNQTKSDDEEGLLLRVNTMYENLFRQLIQSKVRQFVFFSSGGTVYGNSDGAIKENHSLNPISLYARSKIMLEETLQKSNLNYLILRVANPYGGYQMTNKRQGVIPVLVEKALKGETFEMWGSDDSVRDYFFIDDFATILVELFKLNIQNEIINIGSGQGTSLRELIECIEETTSSKIDIKKVSATVNVVDQIVLDITKLQSLVPNLKRTSLNDGVKAEVVRIQEEM